MVLLCTRSEAERTDMVIAVSARIQGRGCGEIFLSFSDLRFYAIVWEFLENMHFSELLI